VSCPELIVYSKMCVKQVRDELDMQERENGPRSRKAVDITSIDDLQRQRELLELHRLFSTLSPEIKSLQGKDAHQMRCSIGQYVGDVLVRTFLCNEQVIEQVQASNHVINHNVDNLYQTWVYLHSRVLRSQRNGNEVLGNLTCSLEEEVSAVWEVSSNFLTCKATLVLDEFAPLGGGAYRGRDRIRLFEMTVRQLIDFIDKLEDETGQTEVEEWILRVHNESKRRRPMTVRNPLIRFSTPERFSH